MVSILLGPGARSELLAALLRALGEARPVVLRDLEELLLPRGGAGRLLLDGDELPPGDIGFVTRFLERHPSWELVLFGVDPSRPAVRALLATDRAGRLPWPPDVDQLARLHGPPAVAPPPSASAPGRREAERAALALAALRGALDRGEDPLPSLESLERALDELRGAPPRDPARRPDPDLFDLHEALEELLAETALGGRPRFRYRSEGDLHLAAPRAAVREALEQILWIAARCAGEGSVVEVRAEGAAEPERPVTVTLDFESGPLGGVDERTALSRDVLAERVSPEAAERGARAARLLKDLGARLWASQGRAGRLRIELLLPRLRGALAGV